MVGSFNKFSLFRNMASLTSSPESAQTSTVPRVPNSNKVNEKQGRDALALRARGELKWATPAGSIDVFTKDEVIEIKHYKNWKNGVGQVKAYGEDHPSHKKRLHLFAHEGEKASKYFEMATRLCAEDGIRVTFEEVVVGRNNLGVDVVDGLDVFRVNIATSAFAATGGAFYGDPAYPMNADDVALATKWWNAKMERELSEFERMKVKRAPAFGIGGGDSKWVTAVGATAAPAAIGEAVRAGKSGASPGAGAVVVPGKWGPYYKVGEFINYNSFNM